MNDEPDPDENSAVRARKVFRSGRWIAAAAVLAYGGTTVMLATVLLTLPSFTYLIGTLLFLSAAGPYGWAIRGRLHNLSISQSRATQSLLDTHQAILDTQSEQLASIKDLTRRIEETTKALKLEQVEEESYAHILDLDPDEIAFMEWPEDGLRDVVIVYFIGSGPIAYRLTIDQMNEVAEEINRRMDEDRNEEHP